MPKVKVIEFKSISPFYEWEKTGDKPFTFRKIDISDKRFYYLGRCCQRDLFRLIIKITNPATGESFERRITEVETMRKYPNWMIVYWEHKE